jgi:hypothetical protein
MRLYDWIQLVRFQLERLESGRPDSGPPGSKTETGNIQESQVANVVVAQGGKPYIESKHFCIGGAAGQVVDRGRGVDHVWIVEDGHAREWFRLDDIRTAVSMNPCVTSCPERPF